MNQSLLPTVPYGSYPSSSMLPPDTTDEGLIEAWLKKGKTESTKAVYRRDIRTFRAFCATPFRQVTLVDVQDYQTELLLLGLKKSTVSRRLKSLKSLLSFGQKTGYLLFNVGTMVSLPKKKEELAQRILSEEEILTMLVMETKPRNHALLRFLYNSGCRVSEACVLTWADISTSGVVTIFGKGEKTRYVKLKPAVHRELLALYKESGPVFVSQKEGHLDSSQVLRIVKRAAERIGIDTTMRPVSPHWLRHSHASHALKRGVSIAVIQATLGHESIETTMNYVHIEPEESSGLTLLG